MADYADCLADFLASLGTGEMHIVGLSWGGTLAQCFYSRHRRNVRSLVLADTYAGWKGSFTEEMVQERLAGCMRESELPPEEWVPGWIPGLLTDGAPPDLRSEVASIMSDFHPAGYRLMTQVLADTDTRDLLPSIGVPTLLLWGRDDRRSPLSAAEAIRDSIPGARLVVIENAGHLSSAEQPARFNAEVREFCRSVPTEHPASPGAI
jgi:pimeloyl-ACP methyl ester carboxylesterase